MISRSDDFRAFAAALRAAASDFRLAEIISYVSEKCARMLSRLFIYPALRQLLVMHIYWAHGILTSFSRAIVRCACSFSA